MDKLRTINKFLTFIVIIGVIVLIITFTFAFFTAGLTGNETSTTITLESGFLELVYDGGPEIITKNIGPSTGPFATKTFTITGTNTSVNKEMKYKALLIIAENTFTANALSYTLSSNNLANNGNVIPEILERQNIKTEDVLLGNGNFINQVNRGVHSYEIKIYFYETGESQSIDMRKTFKAYIKIEENTNM